VPFPDLRTVHRPSPPENDILTMEARVDPHLEVTEIRRPVIADGRPALLFTNAPRVERSDGAIQF